LTGDERLICLLARRDDKDYRPEHQLPPGGQAVVFKATHKITGAPVAIKRPRRRDEDSLMRILREIEAMTRFGGHRNVVPVLSAAGLVNYPAEWWHWSYGDQYLAFQAGRFCVLSR